MTTHALEKWRTLIAQLELVSAGQRDNLVPFNEDQLLMAETRIDHPLPQEYKEYCQVFGSGRFGPHRFLIRTPPLEPIDPRADRINDALKCSYRTYAEEELSSETEALLDAAFEFGSGEDCFLIFFFDLRSYRESDQSCNIYAFCERDTIHIYNLGRSFFAFIRDVCIGNRVEDYPKLIFNPEDLTEEEQESREEDMNDDPLYTPFTFGY
jgi:hypothetical protein